MDLLFQVLVYVTADALPHQVVKVYAIQILGDHDLLLGHLRAELFICDRIQQHGWGGSLPILH